MDSKPSRFSRRAPELLSVSATTAELTPEAQDLAEKLSEIHGVVGLTRESNGLHFYIACPDCLEQYGDSELVKRHLAINVDHILADVMHHCRCMKTNKVYDIRELLAMPTLEARGIRESEIKRDVLSTVSEDYLETDTMGNMVPKGPGQTVPLTALPETHPVIQFVRSRQFDPAALCEQFNASYGIKEREDVYYRKLSGGFRATPQGRLILEVLRNGVRIGWQARILELKVPQEAPVDHYYFHPYENQWVKVMTRRTSADPWEACPGFERWDPVKYATAHGARRKECLMGYDAAVQWCREHPEMPRFCFLVEGPLDAARLGPPAMAFIGKGLSTIHVDHLVAQFEAAIIIPDMDKSGEQALTRSTRLLDGHLPYTVCSLPETMADMAKDVGDLSPFLAGQFRQQWINKMRKVLNL